MLIVVFQITITSFSCNIKLRFRLLILLVNQIQSDNRDAVKRRDGIQMLISQLKDRDCVSLGICVCVAPSR